MELEEQLESQQSEAGTAIGQWEENCTALESQVEELEAEKLNNLKVLKEFMVGRLQAQKTMLSALSKEAPDHGIDLDAVQAVDETSSKFSEALAAREEQLGSAIDDLLKQVASSKEEVGDLQKSFNGAKDEIEKVKTGYEELKASTITKEESDQLIMEANRKAEAEHEAVVELTTKLEEEKQTVSQLSEKISDLSASLESKTSEAEEVSAKSKEAIDALEAKVGKAEEQLVETQQQLSKISEQLSETEQLRQREKEEAANDAARMQGEVVVYQEEICALAEQRDAKNSEVLRLEDELRMANDSMQVFITDEISNRATEMATQALREEMEIMQSTLKGDRDQLLQEQRARQQAEKEVEDLRADLALVLRVEDDGVVCDEKVRSLVMKTSDQVQRKERAEIQQLRDTLDRAMQELEAARQSEREALETASSVEIQVSACEQEIIAAKADVSFMTQNLEETRAAEAARIASYEYRISALEDDRDVLKRVQADELETLRNELSHITMEKDRILNSLKESEKNRAALEYAASMEQEDVGFSTHEREIAKLRAANAQLLSAASDEASRTERRVREAVTANASAFEADNILERELRVAAEAAFENMKEQLEEAKSMQETNALISRSSEPSSEKISIQLKHARAKSQKLERDIVALKAELEEQREAQQNEIEDLTKECRRAQAVALKIERENHFDAEVTAEVSKIRSANEESSDKPDNWIVVRENNPAEEPVDNAAFQAYDYILEQKMAIQEERQMYQELLDEHDAVLNIMAQQDYEKSFLTEALRQSAGQDAVDSAISTAREQVIEQFGQYLQLS